MSYQSDKLHIIKIRVNDEEINLIKQYVSDANLSINTFCKKILLNARQNPQFRADCIMKLIPGFYAKIDQIEDITVRNELKNEVSQICQFLK